MSRVHFARNELEGDETFGAQFQFLKSLRVNEKERLVKNDSLMHADFTVRIG